jgi:putative flippase GtrA
MSLVRFSLVGATGVVVQTAALAVLVHGVGVHYLPASMLALGCAVSHNYLWHACWTWPGRLPAGGHLRGFARFVAGNGLVSLAGAVGLMPVLVEGARLPPVVANLVGVAVIGAINFRLASRWCFPRATTAVRTSEHPFTNLGRRDFAGVRSAREVMPDGRDDAIDGIADRHWNEEEHRRPSPGEREAPRNAQCGGRPQVDAVVFNEDDAAGHLAGETVGRQQLCRAG